MGGGVRTRSPFGRRAAVMTAAQQTRWSRSVLAEEPEATAWGVIRTEIPLLTTYGTAYGLFDEKTAGYDCVLKSDAYQLAEYLGDRVRVSGQPAMVEGMPVMHVTRLQLLKMKWMRR